MSARGIAYLAAFLIVVMGVGAAIGIATAPGPWFEGLQKPWFNPPSGVFAPVWTVLYLFIAIAGWRTFMQDPGGAAMGRWVAQMALNWLWSPVFFTLHLIWPAFVVILLLLALIIGFIAKSWNRDRLSALLFLPYAAWVSFASVLNLSIAVLN